MKYIIPLIATIFLAVSPLSAKGGFGVEINIPRLLTIHDEWQSFSGGFSYFDNSNNVEYAFPIYYHKEAVKGYSDGKDEESFTRFISFDFHYRKFLHKKTEGLYLEGFTRVADISGKTPIYGEQVGNMPKPMIGWKDDSVTRIGLGVGVGARSFYNVWGHDMYFGVSLLVGRYLSGSNKNFYTQNMSPISIESSSDNFVDVEFLKIGYLF